MEDVNKMTEVVIKNDFAGCDKEIAMIARQIEKIIDLAEETNDQGLALSRINDTLAELNLREDFSRAGMLE